jgi:hypothetical protein
MMLGKETVQVALATKNLKATWEIIAKAPQQDSSIMVAFERIGHETITFSHHQHTYEEM